VISVDFVFPRGGQIHREESFVVLGHFAFLSCRRLMMPSRSLWSGTGIPVTVLVLLRFSRLPDAASVATCDL
jgi:hypothetical protein